MIWGESESDYRKRVYHTWCRWYAWRPVMLRDGRWAWLQNVWRKKSHSNPYIFGYEYLTEEQIKDLMEE